MTMGAIHVYATVRTCSACAMVPPPVSIAEVITNKQCIYKYQNIKGQNLSLSLKKKKVPVPDSVALAT